MYKIILFLLILFNITTAKNIKYITDTIEIDNQKYNIRIYDINKLSYYKHYLLTYSDFDLIIKSTTIVDQNNNTYTFFHFIASSNYNNIDRKFILRYNYTTNNYEYIYRYNITDEENSQLTSECLNIAYKLNNKGE